MTAGPEEAAAVSTPAQRPPVVGLTCYAEPATWGPWVGVPAALVPQTYIVMLRAVGARVVVLPPQQGLDADGAADLLARLDGLVVAGGVDVEPSRYGASPHPTIQTPRPDRDDSELALVQAAVALDLPLLGVCRGMQVMAVAAGGTLEQHLPDRLHSAVHSPGRGVYGRHSVTTTEGSRVRTMLGEQVEVPSYHHQGVLTAPGYAPTAWSEDGVMEAIEAPEPHWRVGVQWHPEVGDDPRLFAGFVSAAHTRNPPG